MSKQKEELVEKLSALSVLEMSELKVSLEDKWGVKAAAATAVMAAPAAAAAAGAAPEAAVESTEFKVVLAESPADKKIPIIKVIREITGLGLREAKELVESAPKNVKDTAPKAEAEEMKKKLEEAGAKVNLEGL